MTVAAFTYCAGMRKLSPERERSIIEAYRAWGPSTSSIDDLAVGLGVSRATFYDVLRRNHEPLKSQRSIPGQARAVDVALLDLVANSAAKELMRQVLHQKKIVDSLVFTARQYLEHHSDLARAELESALRVAESDDLL